MKTGLTSITFRQLDWLEVICVANDCGLDGIEWGGDVHAPPGNEVLACKIARATKEAGLSVLSYGSYYRLGAGEPFEPVLATAKTLGAKIIRVWAGTKASAQYTAQERQLAVEDARRIADLAREEGIMVALEYHRDTLTDNAESAVDLLKTAGNIKTYWQPNPELSHEKNCAELKAMLPWLTYLHVFHWSHDGTRLPLENGMAEWQDYMQMANNHAGAAVLEFVRGNDPVQCARDAVVLRSLCQ